MHPPAEPPSTPDSVDRPLPCADATRSVGGSPIGSATAFETFLLLDYRLPWSRAAADDAVRDLLPADTARAVRGRSGLRPFATRPVSTRLNRQLGTDDGTPGLPLIGRVGPGAWIGPLTLRAGLDALDRPLPPGTGSGDPLIGVCTNAKRDRCCAVHGRPVATALHARFGDTVREFSHLGGHRFAATMVVLPTGYLYGHVDPGVADAICRDALEGLVYPHHLRGRADLSAPAQAADAHWRHALGPVAVEDVRIETVTEWDASGELPDRLLVTGIVQGTADTVVVRRVPGPTVTATACSSEPIATGDWIAEAMS